VLLSIEVSIVMNSYNKYPLNLFTLQSLKHQTFDPSKMEVVFVDDASTDRTPKLSRLRTPYHFRYIRLETNAGRSLAKNLAIQAASGKIIIVLDAEMLVHPRLVEEHHRYHTNAENLVVTSCLRHHGVFSAIHPAFNKHQLKHFYSLISKRRSMRRKLRLSSLRARHNIATLSARAQRKGRPIRLLTESAIMHKKYRKFAFPDPLRAEVLQRFGKQYNGYHLPWYCVVTHCISLRRSLYDAVGPFYEGFKGWGFEDWEFGYRLYKQGAAFVDDDRAPVYHQEHPVQPTASIKQDNLENYLRFLQRHHEFAVGVHTLLLLGLRDFVSVNDIMTDFKALTTDHPGEYQVLLDTCMFLFDTIAHRLVDGAPIEGLTQAIQGHDAKMYRTFAVQLGVIRSSGQYPQLTAAIDELLALGGE
jgi:glycosyltransferase involved in cell wall biosynthesis